MTRLWKEGAPGIDHLLYCGGGSAYSLSYLGHASATTIRFCRRVSSPMRPATWNTSASPAQIRHARKIRGLRTFHRATRPHRRRRMPRVTVYFSEKSAEDMRLFRWLVRLPPYQRSRHFKRLALARLLNGAGRPRSRLVGKSSSGNTKDQDPSCTHPFAIRIRAAEPHSRRLRPRSFGRSRNHDFLDCWDHSSEGTSVSDSTQSTS